MYDVHEEISGDTAGSSTEEVNDMGNFSIVEYNINIFLLKIRSKYIGRHCGLMVSVMTLD